MAKISNRQRALWSVLITSLAAPLMAGIAALAVTAVMQVFGFAALGAGANSVDASIGGAGLSAFAWSALPATIGALALVPYVLESGTYGWLHAAVAGVLAFGASTIVAPLVVQPLMPVLAFCAGLLGIAIRDVLIRIRILKP
jgi:hypothetical protein